MYIDEVSAALEHLQEKYDAIILDLDLCNGDGKILSSIAAARIHTPIIALSQDNNQTKKNDINIKAILKKKQEDYNRINLILEEILIK